jgi:hypothetical protein
MNKIAIFYPHIGEYGGIERNIIALATQIDKMGFKPVIICYYDFINLVTYYPGLEMIVLNDHWNPFIKAIRLKGWFNQNKHQLQGLPLFFGAKAGFYASLGRLVPYALHYTDPPSLLSNPINNSLVYTLLMTPRQSASNWFIKQGVQQAQVCITMTKWNAEELEYLYKRPFIVVYQGGVPVPDKLHSVCFRFVELVHLKTLIGF